MKRFGEENSLFSFFLISVKRYEEERRAELVLGVKNRIKEGGHSASIQRRKGLKQE